MKMKGEGSPTNFELTKEREIGTMRYLKLNVINVLTLINPVLVDTIVMGFA